MSSIPDTADQNRPLHVGVTATTREVYPTNEGTVIKVPQSSSDERPNEQEVRHWNYIKDDTMLAPIVDHAEDYSWIEMEMCRCLDKIRDRPLFSIFDEKRREKDYNIFDTHHGNIGILPSNGEIVCLDYAAMEFPQR